MVLEIGAVRRTRVRRRSQKGSLVGTVLGAVVGAGVGGVAVGAVGLLLLVVDGHEVLHIHGLLPLLVRADTDGRQAAVGHHIVRYVDKY
jgi:hypothetical protein